MSASALQIFVLRNGTLLASEVFPEGVYVIGSDPGCDLVLDDPSVALNHAQLQFGAGQVNIIDEAGAGVHVNSELVQDAAVKSGDDVHIGPFLLKIRALAKRRAAPAVAAAPLPKSASPSAATARQLSPSPSWPAPRLAPVPAAAPARPSSPPAARALSAVPDELDDIDALFEKVISGAPVLRQPAVAAPSEVEPLPEALLAKEPEPIDVDLLDVEELEPLPETAVITEPIAAAPVRAPASAEIGKIEIAKAARPPKAVTSSHSAAGALLAAPVLHARVLWGDAVVAARTFRSSDAVRTCADERGGLPAYGFPLVQQLAAFDRGGWRVQPPQGVEVLERIAHGPWRPATLDAAGFARLETGRSLRLASRAVQIELLAQLPPQLALGSLRKLLDVRGISLVLVLGAAFAAFLALLPPVPLHIPDPPPPPRRIVRTELKKKEKPKKEKAKKELAQTQTAAPQVAPSAAQSARTYRAAAAPMKALEKITKATREVSGLLAALKTASAMPRGGSVNALAMLGGPGKGAPSPLPGIGDNFGMGGPVTRGRDLLRGGPGGSAGDLGNGTAARGPVRGVPVKLPSRPTRIQGQIDRDAVAQVINDHVGEIRGCYERALLTNPNIGAGKVALEWTIGAEGTVTEIGTKTSTLRSPEVVGCVLDLFRGLRFPKPQGGVVIVSYPLLFNAVGN